MTKITKENMQNAHDELLQTFVDKNADYGNSFESSLEEYGLIAALIRMDDKMGRLRTLIKSEAKVKDESISDTLRDLSNYALMASVWVDNKPITQEVSEAINRIKELTFDPIKAFTDEAKPFKKNTKAGYYSDIHVFGPGAREVKRFYDRETKESAGEIEIQNAEQLRLYLYLHKEKGAISVASGIGRDLFYRIDFTEFYTYIKELRNVPIRKGEKFEIYFNLKNEELNEFIYVRMNNAFTAYRFFNIKDYEAAVNQFIAFKKYLLDKAEHPLNIKALIKADAERQNSPILKPRVRIDDTFVSMMLWDNDEINYDKNHGGDYYQDFLNKQFIYDMFEGTTDPDYGRYTIVPDNNGNLAMMSTPAATLERFRSKTFLDSFQRKLDSGSSVKLVKIPQ